MIRSWGVFTVAVAVCCLIVSPGNLAAQEQLIEFTGEEIQVRDDYSPYAGTSYPDKVLFGEMHLHTKYSADAGLVGTNLDIDDAYRFAAGEMVTSNTGQRVQLVRPLDFTIVSDHAEYIGLAPMIFDSNPVLLADPYGKWLHDQFRSGPDGAREAYLSLIKEAEVGETKFSPAATESIWKGFVETADKYNQPGVFTALIGFEWTSVANGDNLHRVVCLPMERTKPAR